MVLLIAAIVVFLVAAFTPPPPRLNLIAVGLALFAASFLLSGKQ
jgi:uncharacterized membrane protein